MLIEDDGHVGTILATGSIQGCCCCVGFCWITPTLTLVVCRSNANASTGLGPYVLPGVITMELDRFCALLRNVGELGIKLLV